LPGFELERVDDVTLNAEVRSDTVLHALFDGLAAEGVRVKAVRNAANRLEQLFMDMLENADDGRG
jgi:ABC-2 type transport system ATP-binding protein